MDFTPSLNAKQFFRFTGPPEHWLTAVKYMTWGLTRDKEAAWKMMQPGDVFFIHSTGPGSSLFSNARSGIIGLGVIGSNFSIKDNYLWIKEFEDRQNTWPLLVPLAEIYLFSKIPDPATWDNPNLENKTQTAQLIQQLLSDLVPLSQIKGFPQMGSFSKVSESVSKQILFAKKPLYAHENLAEDNIEKSKRTPLQKIEKASESLRYSESLKVFETVSPRIVTEEPGTYTKNNELLARAESVHSSVLQQLIDIFKAKGYETRSNKYVDLFAYNEKQSYLIEVKSTENRNFKSQARKGMIQLFEYDYFEIDNFTKENDLHFENKFKILVPSKEPEDKRYIDFINFLDIGVGVVKDKLVPVGKNFISDL